MQLGFGNENPQAGRLTTPTGASQSLPQARNTSPDFSPKNSESRTIWLKINVSNKIQARAKRLSL